MDTYFLISVIIPIVEACDITPSNRNKVTLRRSGRPPSDKRSHTLDNCKKFVKIYLSLPTLLNVKLL